ncbi:MAG: SDR family oxidoreductase [Anaerolineaceae bacterium]|nr:SDR family oxidoreductase [Anaerolineaceae bacterium]
MPDSPVMLITGARKGIGRYLAEYYLGKGWHVVGCSRSPTEFEAPGYQHYCLDVADEKAARALFAQIRKEHGRLDALLNNAGAAAMNHALLTPIETVLRLLNTNVAGTFLFCREAARLMQARKVGRIVNFTTVAVPLMLEGEAAYAASKAAVTSLTQILARELAPLGITVNAIGPTPIDTDLIRGIPQEKLDRLLQQQAIHRFGEFTDISNTIDFFLRPESNFITGQVIYLGGVS